ncbi:hypothetical protein Bpfe_018950, partial [Biomphalaria pfeifferi]
IDTWDENSSKEVRDFPNSTKQMDSMRHISTCHKVSRLIIKPNKMWFYEILCLPDLDLCLLDKNCCEDFPTECPHYLKESLKGFERMLGLQGNCLELVNSLSTFGCPHKSNWLKKAEDEVETSWYNENLLYTRSCRNRCSRRKPDKVKSGDILCSCDVRCPVYRNCCEDFPTECLLVHNESLKRFGHMMNLQVDCLDVANTFAIFRVPTSDKLHQKIDKSRFIF